MVKRFTIECAECGEPFEPSHHTNTICSEACKNARAVRYRREYRAKKRARGLCVWCSRPSPVLAVCRECQPVSGAGRGGSGRGRRSNHPLGYECKRCGKKRTSMKQGFTRGYCGGCYATVREQARSAFLRSNPDVLMEIAMRELHKDDELTREERGEER